MVPNDYFCTGQMSIFDILTEKDDLREALTTPQSSLALTDNQAVFRVTKGLIDIFIYKGDNWTIEKDGVIETIYSVQDGHGYDSFPESALGITYFTTAEEAENKAEQYILEHRNDILIVRPKDIVQTVAWSFIRACDGRKMTAFISELKNGMTYMKDFYTYYHVLDKKFDKVLKEYTKSFTFRQHDNLVEEVNFTPITHILYACEEGNSWTYAEARYGGCKKYD